MKKIFITSLFILISFFIKTDVVQADIACNPYNCAPQNTYARVNSCAPSSGFNCLNTSVSNSIVYNCSNGGTPGSCQGSTPGVESCGGRVYQSGSSCTCDNLSSCTTNGASCGAYGTCTCNESGVCNAGSPGGPAIYADGCPAGSCPPRDGTRSCCVISSTPTPTPSLWCGDGVCSGSIGESCSNCETDCGVCSPPPGPYCGDNICNNGETNCTCATDCSGTCPSPASCSVSLSPSSVNMYTDDSPFTITANVSNIQNGNVSQVEFAKSNNNINLNPIFDTNGTPYQSQITPAAQGSTTITARVYMGGSTVRCSATATVNVNANTTPSDAAPNCESFQVTTPNVTQGGIANFVAELTDEGFNLVGDGGFESGTVTQFPTAHQLNSWWAVPNSGPQAIPPGAEGAYYSAISRAAGATDPHAATGWLQTGENLSNQQYTFKFLAKSHEANKTINGILIQREPFNGDWAGGGAYTGPINIVPGSWTQFSFNLTFPTPANGSNTTRLRAVLRPSPDAWPIYYDSVKVYKTNTAGVNPSTVRFYYIPTSGNPCATSPNQWTLIGTGTRIGTTNFYQINWNTTGVPAGDYTVAVNATDVQGNQATGNPGNCGNPAFTYRPACNNVQTITTCAPSCGGTTCGNTNQTPSAVSNISVSGISGNNLNLSNNPLPRTITWTAATVASPGAISAYDVWLVPRGAAIPATAAACDTSATCRRLTWSSGTSVSLPSVLAAQTNNFDIVIRARNGCSTNGAWTRRAVDLTANVTGNIYDAEVTPNGSNNCAIPNPVPSLLNISAGYDGMTSSTGGNVTTAPGTSYVMSNVPYAPTSSWAPDYNFNLSLQLDSPDPSNTFYCTCPGANCTHTNTASPATNQHFYITTVDLSNGPWWQAREGNVYGALAYTSSVPDSASSFLVTRNTASNLKSAGIPLSGGTINANGFFTEYNGTAQPRANSTTHTNMLREDYNYLIRDINTATVSRITLGTVTNFGTGAGGVGTGTVYDDTQVHLREGDLTINLTSNQTIASGTKKVIFVSGNVIIRGAQNQHRLTVADGGYLAVIAGGNITFENTIGNTCSFPAGCSSTNTNIDGVYVASNQLIIADNGNGALPDNIFIGEGTFVGWNGIRLNRSFDVNSSGNVMNRALNNTYPTNIFRFRPDFNENTPEILRRPNLVWQEVN